MRKCFFGHRWEEIPVSKRKVPRSGFDDNGFWFEGDGTDFRVCLKCNSVQEWIKAVNPEFRTGWYDKLSFSKDEQHLIDKHKLQFNRDMKLKKLLK